VKAFEARCLQDLDQKCQAHKDRRPDQPVALACPEYGRICGSTFGLRVLTSGVPDVFIAPDSLPPASPEEKKEEGQRITGKKKYKTGRGRRKNNYNYNFKI
jgi:hypothetical protein